MKSIFEPLGFTNDYQDNGAFTHRLGVPEGKSSYKIISTIRNPYKRYLSVYRWQSKFQTDNLHEYVISQFGDYHRLNNIDIKHGVNYWIDTECIKEGLLNIPLVVENLDKVQDKINNLEHNPFKNEGRLEAEMTQELADEIYQKFRFVFERFGYHKNSWK